MAILGLLLSSLIASAAALPQYGQSSSSNSDKQLGPTNKYVNAPSYPGYAQQSSAQSGAALGWFQADSSVGGQASATEYHCYQGVLSSYPGIDRWLPFEKLWHDTQDSISKQNGGDQNLVGYIHDAILKVSSESKVDARLILATVMQESKGQASITCTWNKWINAWNCGLMQGPPNSISFDPTQPESSILQMIRDGVEGTTSGGNEGAGGPGLVQYLTQDYSWVHNPSVGNPFTAARAYNSGSVVAGNLDAGGATVAYVNDIANRLLGWGSGGEGSPFDWMCGHEQ